MHARLIAAGLIGSAAIAGCGGSDRPDEVGPPADEVFFRLESFEPHGLTLTSVDEETYRSFTFELPSDAAQGPTDWYVGSLHFTAQVAATGPDDGRGYISVFTNGRAFAQVKVETSPGRGTTEWSGVSLVDGAIGASTTDGSVTGSYRNYLQIEGVRPGTNEITFDVRPADGIIFREVFVQADAVIYSSSTSPQVRCPPDSSIHCEKIAGLVPL